ncbi:HesB/IscA family protein [Gloeothece verrucosa]|uniref:Iron-sulfur cluster assembly accessory protein n=1 Tax=Gloeothece verrucosa (strain PCC 7822) TaxID=497965 RepID=E0UDC2_GLOV7|nr:iron-sulfur cluster assembly accessory protein [Gloeothece verrucosa]ADN14113.1 iron-sulfur cluster assembly accessory protein [Gloeothece verrucosa PCC 7822]
MIDLTGAAANEIRRLQHSRSLGNSYFRVRVKPGGCSGLYYVLDFCPQPEIGDHIYESLGINIIIDADTHHYLKKLTIDYAEDLMGGSFRFHNPSSSENCGCGLSFNIAV